MKALLIINLDLRWGISSAIKGKEYLFIRQSPFAENGRFVYGYQTPRGDDRHR